ncbi:Rieske (2Fe-2S) protein [Mycolicibacterium cosmeticum]|uniref:Rieske (2Fe-2S) domain-containing protein n=1 Tax=Mycolicibacterium cosmeticum TaxID=258533 RepID=W9AVB4_MYCCO|nr:Rieske (2Fe-2S) protein [Mycolicibacterium cosmeticum]TLH74586.1 Rieske (2Fe-2S) protein [Mycolicibacterium cosmeticum]CDO09754.1 Rieske (2Fe-2S) domain-containing protein [Mycolicibacterium cosmeticum]
MWIAVATTKDLERRRKLRVEVDGLAIALFQAGGRVYALADLCVHQDRSLFKGTLLDGKVICPGHQWQFDLETGYEADQDRCQPSYPVRVQDGTVYVDTASVGHAPVGREEGAKA